MWDDVVRTCGHQRLFCGEACVAAWLARSGHERGYVMDLATLWRLARGWYDGPPGARLSASRALGGARVLPVGGAERALLGPLIAPARPRGLLDRVVHLEQRHVHRDHDEPDDAADDHEHHRLEDRRQRLDGRGDLVLVEVGDLRQHRVERAGLLAHADHVADHAREDRGLLERVGDRAAALHRLDDVGHRVLDDAVARGLGR